MVCSAPYAALTAQLLVRVGLACASPLLQTRGGVELRSSSKYALSIAWATVVNIARGGVTLEIRTHTIQKLQFVPTAPGRCERVVTPVEAAAALAAPDGLIIRASSSVADDNVIDAGDLASCN